MSRSDSTTNVLCQDSNHSDRETDILSADSSPSTQPHLLYRSTTVANQRSVVDGKIRTDNGLTRSELSERPSMVDSPDLQLE